MLHKPHEGSGLNTSQGPSSPLLPDSPAISPRYARIGSDLTNSHHYRLKPFPRPLFACTTVHNSLTHSKHLVQFGGHNMTRTNAVSAQPHESLGRDHSPGPAPQPPAHQALQGQTNASADANSQIPPRGHMLTCCSPLRHVHGGPL